jgi:hypothetical protein
VAAAHVDPLGHFQGRWLEGRAQSNALFDTAGYLATYTDVKAAGITPSITITIPAGTKAATLRSISTRAHIF